MRNTRKKALKIGWKMCDKNVEHVAEPTTRIPAQKCQQIQGLKTIKTTKTTTIPTTAEVSFKFT